MHTTKFQDTCYKALQINVPAGRVITYKNLAILTGNPRASRAVGNAMNKNPFAPHVPCHRVVKSDGSIGGFASSIEKKIQLLREEGIEIDGDRKIKNFKKLLISP